MKSAKHAALDLQGWFTDAEGAWYAELAGRELDRHPTLPIVEVGCWKGRSTSFLVGALAGRPGRLWCVDHWGGSSDEHDAAYRETLALEPVAAIFRENMRALGIPYRLLAMPSVDAARRFADDSCALVFLDASHDRAAVEADIAAWYPKVAPGGVLAGHDFRPECPGVVAAVETLAWERKAPIKTGPGSTWACARPA